MRREGEGKEGGEIDSKRGGQSGKEERSVKERGRERDRGGERERESRALAESSCGENALLCGENSSRAGGRGETERRGRFAAR